MKHYLFFSAQFLPHMGGVENYTYHLAKALIAGGNKVTVVTSMNVPGTKTYENMEGIQVYRLSCLNLMDGRYPIMKFDAVYRKVNHILSENQFDLVIINTRFYLLSLYGVLFAKKHHYRCILIEHGTGHLAMHHPLLDVLENLFEHTITMAEKMLCKEFYGVSEACLDWLKHFHIKGKGVIYNAIDLEYVESELQHPACSYRELYQIPGDAIAIAFTGRLLKEKGILTLIQAVENMNKTDRKVYLLIAGDGDEEEAVRARTSEHIIALGRITASQVIALLRETDIFCLPSDSEGMPTSVLEAAACRNYIVTTKRGGAKELLIDDKYGMVLENNRLETVQGALEKAVEDSDMRRTGTELTYTRLRKLFTWERAAERVMEL